VECNATLQPHGPGSCNKPHSVTCKLAGLVECNATHQPRGPGGRWVALRCTRRTTIIPKSSASYWWVALGQSRNERPPNGGFPLFGVQSDSIFLHRSACHSRVVHYPFLQETRVHFTCQSKVDGPLVPVGVVTGNDSITVPPPTSVPVKLTVGAVAKGKSRARSIERNVNGWPLSWTNLSMLSGGLDGANVDTPIFPSKVDRIGAMRLKTGGIAGQRTRRRQGETFGRIGSEKWCAIPPTWIGDVGEVQEDHAALGRKRCYEKQLQSDRRNALPARFWAHNSFLSRKVRRGLVEG
jgi:hypothetical protein